MALILFSESEKNFNPELYLPSGMQAGSGSLQVPSASQVLFPVPLSMKSSSQKYQTISPGRVLFISKSRYPLLGAQGSGHFTAIYDQCI